MTVQRCDICESLFPEGHPMLTVAEVKGEEPYTICHICAKREISIMVDAIYERDKFHQPFEALGQIWEFLVEFIGQDHVDARLGLPHTDAEEEDTSDVPDDMLDE